MTAPEPNGGVEVWRGGVNTWECDEMGHMNVRFYVQRAQEALAGLALRLGMPHAFAADAHSTLRLRRHHIRFLAEATAGAPLHMQGGVVEMGDDTADLVFVLMHGDGRPCASFRTRVQHATPDGRPFPWPERARLAAQALRWEPPAVAQPRSVTTGEVFHADASLERADALKLTCIARGVVEPAACDARSRMNPSEFIGRVSDGIGVLLAGVRQTVQDAATERPERLGGAVLEYRLDYLRQPRLGDHVEVRSGIAEITDRYQRMAHWSLDPVSGKPWAVSEAVAINFDLDRRKVVPIAQAARDALAHRITPELLAG